MLPALVFSYFFKPVIGSLASISGALQSGTKSSGSISHFFLAKHGGCRGNFIIICIIILYYDSIIDSPCDVTWSQMEPDKALTFQPSSFRSN